MKIMTLQIVLISAVLSSPTLALAGSNNGYTTATNVYSGSSSLGWYGGGVKYWLAEWKKESEALTAVQTDAAETLDISSESDMDIIELETTDH